MTTTNSPTMADVRRAAKRIGASVEDERFGNEGRILIDLPSGKVIDGAHGCIEGFIGREQRSEAIQAVLEWMSHPVEDGCECVDQENCDHCNP